MRQGFQQGHSRHDQFQSTHPLRGATASCMENREFIHISIHAPLAGCDKDWQGKVYYQSISIHAPLAGCDARRQDCRSNQKISIHAPLAGCDGRSVDLALWNTDFNPRTPCGVRQELCNRCDNLCQFQSTHPLRGATFFRTLETTFAKISIHAPLAGCDPPVCCDISLRRHFNPRTPCGVRQSVLTLDGTAYPFQSTHPLRGATRS